MCLTIHVTFYIDYNVKFHIHSNNNVFYLLQLL